MPRISIIVATYNRCSVLAHVLDALRHQSITDWEALVIGDACTDGTEAMVAGLGDTRFRFVNLPRNHGEQSAANNEGVRLAGSETIAFLNHDDFWRRDHLAHALERLADPGCDLAYTWTANLLTDGTVVLLGMSPRGAYTADLVVPASSWVVKRALLDRVGPWRSGWTLRLSPSQEWLWRASRLGATLCEIPRVSVLGLPSGSRARSYQDDDAGEHARWHGAVVESDAWAEELLTRYVSAQTRGGRLPSSASVGGQVSWALRNGAAHGVAALGLHPLAAWLTMRHPGRGGFLHSLRRRRGLPPRSES